MANITNFSQIDMFDPAKSAFSTHLSHTATNYTWLAQSTFHITLLSGAENITVNGANVPTGGTINAVVSSDTPAVVTNYTATGLSAPITSFFDASLNLALSHEKYWRTLLAGNTTLSSPNGDGDVSVMGDFFTVKAGEVLTGATDSFKWQHGFAAVAMIAFGDADDVLTTGTLTGGGDSFVIGNPAGYTPRIAGDVRTHSGTVNGGADTILVTGRISQQSNITGDAEVSDGILNGGGDRITIQAEDQSGGGSSHVSGDVDTARREVNGGNDIIAISSSTIAPQAFGFDVAGDATEVNAATSVVVGGNDNIAITNASVSSLAGDANVLSAGVLTGGNDKITINGSLGITISGDVGSFTGGTLTPGSDNITGGGGNDVIFGESAEPGFPAIPGATVNVGGNDVINGGGGNDSIKGQTGNDVITGGLGDDTIDGGSGTDTVSFEAETVSVYVDLQGIAGTDTGAGLAEAIGVGRDHILNVEFVKGSALDDTILGDGITNSLFGFAGADTLNGRAGNDLITGGLGKDTLFGGTGSDRFIFNALNETSASQASADIIGDFAAGDRIDLRGIDANVSVANDQAFSFQTAALSGAAQVRAFQDVANGVTIVEGSTDADAAAEFKIVLTGALTLADTSFLL